MEEDEDDLRLESNSHFDGNNEDSSSECEV